jgi:hypothetical protein
MTRDDLIDHIAKGLAVHLNRVNKHSTYSAVTYSTEELRDEASAALEATESAGVKVFAPLPVAEVAERDDQRCYVGVEMLIHVHGRYLVDEDAGSTVYVPLETEQ